MLSWFTATDGCDVTESRDEVKADEKESCTNAVGVGKVMKMASQASHSDKMRSSSTAGCPEIGDVNAVGVGKMMT